MALSLLFVAAVWIACGAWYLRVLLNPDDSDEGMILAGLQIVLIVVVMIGSVWVPDLAGMT